MIERMIYTLVITVCHIAYLKCLLVKVTNLLSCEQYEPAMEHPIYFTALD